VSSRRRRPAAHTEGNHHTRHGASRLQHTQKCVAPGSRGPPASARTAGRLSLQPTNRAIRTRRGRRTRRTWRAPASSKDHPGAHSTRYKAGNGKAGGIERPRTLSKRRQWRAAACRAPGQAGHLYGASQPIAIARQDHYHAPRPLHAKTDHARLSAKAAPFEDSRRQAARPKMTGPASGGARPHTRRFWHVWLTLGHRLDKPVGALLPQLAPALRG
jgi:hypothetical protein